MMPVSLLYCKFDGKFVNYPRFMRECQTYRRMYHSKVSDDLAAKTLREKCISEEF
jgi:hypothetical protein